MLEIEENQVRILQDALQDRPGRLAARIQGGMDRAIPACLHEEPGELGLGQGLPAGGGQAAAVLDLDDQIKSGRGFKIDCGAVGHGDFARVAIGHDGIILHTARKQ